jgi:hypothetical protein
MGILCRIIEGMNDTTNNDTPNPDPWEVPSQVGTRQECIRLMRELKCQLLNLALIEGLEGKRKSKKGPAGSKETWKLITDLGKNKDRLSLECYSLAKGGAYVGQSPNVVGVKPLDLDCCDLYASGGEHRNDCTNF